MNVLLYALLGVNLLLFVLYVIYFLRGRWNPIPSEDPLY